MQRRAVNCWLEDVGMAAYIDSGVSPGTFARLQTGDRLGDVDEKCGFPASSVVDRQYSADLYSEDVGVRGLEFNTQWRATAPADAATSEILSC